MPSAYTEDTWNILVPLVLQIIDTHNDGCRYVNTRRMATCISEDPEPSYFSGKEIYRIQHMITATLNHLHWPHSNRCKGKKPAVFIDPRVTDTALDRVMAGVK